jgi:hypothetical protein
MVADKKTITVSLKEAVAALETMSDQIHSFLNLKTGEWVSLSDETLSFASSDVDLQSHPAWERELILIAKDILESDDYLELPDRFDIQEYTIMDEFCRSLNERLRDDLLDQIRGRGAVRRFKKAIRRHKIENQWYEFREKSLEAIVIKWLEKNHINYKIP